MVPPKYPMIPTIKIYGKARSPMAPRRLWGLAQDGMTKSSRRWPRLRRLCDGKFNLGLSERFLYDYSGGLRCVCNLFFVA